MSSSQYNYFHDFGTKATSMKLEDSNVTKFKVAKEFCENKARINSIDFSPDGKNLISSSDDDTIVLYDCEKGVKKREIMSKKYGCDLIKYTHATNTAIHTSNKENDIIRYLSLHDNKYIRYFAGHEKRVTTLSMSPSDDTFLSISLDNTIRLWTLNTEKLIGRIVIDGPATASYDPEGLIFAVAQNSEYIKLYDTRNYEKGPFNTIHLTKTKPDINWKSLKFSPNGKQILITTDMEEIYINDAFSGQPIKHFSIGPTVLSPIENICEATYTPDSQFILCGSIDGFLHVWSANRFNKVATLKPERSAPEAVQCVKFNPKYMLIASACSRMSFWIPPVEETESSPCK